MNPAVKQSTRLGETFRYYSNFKFINVDNKESSKTQDVLCVTFNDEIQVRLYGTFERDEDIDITRNWGVELNPPTKKLNKSKIQIINDLLNEYNVGRSLRKRYFEALEKWKL